jgi:methyltransferase (TIGR00027 family)
MQDGQPSRTAQRVAIRRAAHQILDSPRVLDDPLAVPILGAEAAARFDAERGKGNSPAARYARAYLVARSRYAEDELARAMGRGTSQYVILGAGLETFAYRNPHAESSLRVFEVDHPATQGWKLKRLAAAGIAIPGSVIFAPVDFERESLFQGSTERTSGVTP